MAASQASELCRNMLEQIFQVPEGASTPVGSDPHSGIDGSAHYRLQTRAQKGSTTCPRSCGIQTAVLGLKCNLFRLTFAPNSISPVPSALSLVTPISSTTRQKSQILANLTSELCAKGKVACPKGHSVSLMRQIPLFKNIH